MVDNDAAEASPEAGAGEPDPAAWEKAKRLLVIAVALIASGLGVSGSLDQKIGGALLLGGWLAGIAALHRLGRAGSSR